MGIQHERSSERGQVSVMIAVMMSTFLLLFAFVVNTGMLVNAKINLQNAADLAAYAGASVQARQLTHISYLNYEMRRQWKKLLFRLYVIGNMAQDKFPQARGSGAMEYVPNNNSPGVSYGVPSTCIIFNAQDNYCHLTSLPEISIPPPNFFDSISDTLNQQLSQIELIRQQNCNAIGETNQLLNLYWLLNGDPTTENIQSAGLDPDQANALRITQGLMEGLGIIPTEIILKFRINTLVDYLNAAPQKAMDVTAAGTLNGSQDPSAFERSIQAFYSAYYTLGNHIFADSSIQMDELTNSELVKLTPWSTKLGTVVVDLKIGANEVGADATRTASPCTAQLLLVAIDSPITIGFSKDPSVLTYYAVRLKAKAKILFSPFGAVDLKAYAAADPIVSLIGPANPAFSYEGTAMGTPVTVPNLPVTVGDSAGAGSGWDTKSVVGTMYGPISAAGAAGGITNSGLVDAYRLAMAPNPFEQGQYNIINDEGSDSFMRNFGTNRMAALWAPVVAPGKESTVTEVIKTELTSLFPTLSGNIGINKASALSKLQTAVSGALTSYIGSLQLRSGERGESLYVAVLENPFLSTPPADRSLFLTQPTAIKTSWNDVNDGDLFKEGRAGYSVKFVSFNSLSTSKLPAGGAGATWTNDLGADSELEGDLQFILH